MHTHKKLKIKEIIFDKLKTGICSEIAQACGRTQSESDSQNSENEDQLSPGK